MKVYIRTSKGDTDLLPDTVDCAHRISGIESSINSPLKLTKPNEYFSTDSGDHSSWVGSDELYPSNLVFDFGKYTDDRRDSGNLALLLQSFDSSNLSRFSLAIDGWYYQNVGTYRCLDTSTFPVGFSYLTIDANPVLPLFGKWSVSTCGFASSQPGTTFNPDKPIFLVSRIG